MNNLQDIIDNNRKYFRIAGWVVLALFALYVFGGVRAALNEQSDTAASTESVSADAEATGDAVATGADGGETKATSTTKGAEPKRIGEVEVVISGSLNIRSSTSTSSKVVGSAPKGSKLGVLAKESGWYKVVDSKGLEGYVSADGRFVKVLSMDQ